MITEDTCWDNFSEDLNCQNILFKSIIRNFKAFGQYENRVTCSVNSLIYISMMEEIKNGLIIITYEEPYHPSYNNECPTNSYDTILTDKGKTFLEYQML